MELKEIMKQNTFVVLGDTLNEEKYAFKIKKGLVEHGYNVYSVGKELGSINDVEAEIDIIDMCIHPAKGLALLKENQKPFKCIVIQPGAESDELLKYLNENNLPYLQSCLLVGMKLYSK